MHKIGVGIIGSGAIALANHVPGLSLCSDARLAALCDADEQVLAKAASRTGIDATFTDYREMLQRDDVHAVIVATPNFTHPEVVEDACGAGKHVLCEKPLALTLDDARRMLKTAERAGVRHMTAFTYRFAPAMRYMKQLIDAGAIGTPLHFRAQRFQDWGNRPLGWRQVKKLAGTGEMADMLSHRIDYGHHLLGPIARLVAQLRTFVPVRGDQPSDVDDWVAMLAEFDAGPTGVLESTKLATGRGEGHRGRDAVEVNGTEGTLVYSTQRPYELERGQRGGADLEPLRVPRELLTWPGSDRDPQQGDPLVTFRYDQTIEFITAIRENRTCNPSFHAGVAVQAVMEAAEQSAREKRWVDVPKFDAHG